jgi:hypothetical protein
MSTLAEDVATLTATVEDLNVRTVALLEQYMLLIGLMQQSLLTASNGESTFAQTAYQSAQESLQAAQEALQSAQQAQAASTSVTSISDKIIYWG